MFTGYFCGLLVKPLRAHNHRLYNFDSFPQAIGDRHGKESEKGEEGQKGETEIEEVGCGAPAQAGASFIQRYPIVKPSDFTASQTFSQRVSRCELCGRNMAQDARRRLVKMTGIAFGRTAPPRSHPLSENRRADARPQPGLLAQRKEIAKKAAKARWARDRGGD